MLGRRETETDREERERWKITDERVCLEIITKGMVSGYGVGDSWHVGTGFWLSLSVMYFRCLYVYIFMNFILDL